MLYGTNDLDCRNNSQGLIFALDLQNLLWVLLDIRSNNFKHLNLAAVL